MNTRLKELRTALQINQESFGKKIGVTGAAVSRWESGAREIPDTASLSIVREFGCSETWLRTGEGEMFRPMGREAELGRLIRTRLYDRPESFQAELIRTLLRFDPDSPEMRVLEQIILSLKYSSYFDPKDKKDPEP